MKWKYKSPGKIKITKDSHIQSEYLYGACYNLAILIAVGVQINVWTKMFHNFIAVISMCCFVMSGKII